MLRLCAGDVKDPKVHFVRQVRHLVLVRVGGGWESFLETGQRKFDAQASEEAKADAAVALAAAAAAATAGGSIDATVPAGASSDSAATDPAAVVTPSADVKPSETESLDEY